MRCIKIGVRVRVKLDKWGRIYIPVSVRRLLKSNSLILEFSQNEIKLLPIEPKSEIMKNLYSFLEK